MAASKVSLMDKDKGKADKEFRTSTTYFLQTGSDAVLLDIDERVQNLTCVGKEHQEAVQVSDSLTTL
jgi:hypothetical protein